MSATQAGVLESRRAVPARIGWRIALAVALAHGINDIYASFLNPLLPRIMARMDLSIALAAVLTTAVGLSASLLQPLMGAAADRFGARSFVILGPLLSAVFMSALGIAPSFLVLAIFLAIGGLGSALFHPPAMALAAASANSGGSGARMSLFSFGGALGFALGPLVAVGIVARFGIERLWLAALPALPLLALLLYVIPGRPAVPLPGPHARFMDGVRGISGPVAVLFGISAIGAFVQRVFLTLQPIAIAHAGLPEALGATTLSTYLAAQAAGSIAGGLLTDRYDRRTVLFWLMALAIPAHALALWLPPGSAAALLATIVAGVLNMALLAPIVVMAQEASPHGAATSSGIVMGLAWAAGALAMIPAGMLGDVVGARGAALLSLPIMLLGCLWARHPALRPFRRPAVIA